MSEAADGTPLHRHAPGNPKVAPLTAIALSLCIGTSAWPQPAVAGNGALAVPWTIELERAVQVGVASWYDQEHASRPMANGMVFDPSRLTAAHRGLPLGSRVRVTHLGSGRSVIVTITDRGPYVAHRVIDLSRQAARQLGMARAGTARVRIEVL